MSLLERIATIIQSIARLFKRSRSYKLNAEEFVRYDPRTLRLTYHERFGHDQDWYVWALNGAASRKYPLAYPGASVQRAGYLLMINKGLS